MATDGPKISVIVLTWNGAAYMEGCLASLLAQGDAGLQVLVVDNGSIDGTPDLVAGQFPRVELIRNGRNLGFAAGNNVGLRAARGDMVVLLNQDTEVRPGFLAALARTFEDPTVGIAGCKLLYPDGTVQHAGGYLYGPRGETGHVGRHAPDEGPFDQVADADFVTAAALAVRRTTLARIGLLDEGFAPAYYEDVDWCYRARAAGFRVVYQPGAVAIHHESTATSAAGYERKYAWNQGRIRFLFKHWQLDRLLGEFAPAELSWLASMERNEELMAARRACLDTLLALPGVLAFRGSSPQEARRLLSLLVDLREAALTSLLAQAADGILSAPVQQARARDAEERARLLDLLQANQAIHEQPFTSQVPVVGPLIVAVRRAWNSVSTKWYVRPMMHQQSVFNGQVTGYLQLLQQQIADQERRLEGRLLDVTENIRELTALAERLARLEEAEPEGHAHD